MIYQILFKDLSTQFYIVCQIEIVSLIFHEIISGYSRQIISISLNGETRAFYYVDKFRHLDNHLVMAKHETFEMSTIGYVKCKNLRTKDDYHNKQKKQTFPAEVVLKPEFQDALDEIETFDHVWLIWVFSQNIDAGYQLKVHPGPDPKNLRSLFVTRSPYRPNPIGISCVKVSGHKGNILMFENADILDNTPILDIKPYIPGSDSRPDSKAGWIDNLLD